MKHDIPGRITRTRRFLDVASAIGRELLDDRGTLAEALRVLQRYLPECEYQRTFFAYATSPEAVRAFSDMVVRLDRPLTNEEWRQFVVAYNVPTLAELGITE